MRRLFYASLALLLVACSSGPVGNKQVPEPTKAVELDRYLGKWYEIARYENRFEKGCEGVTAEYSMLEDGKIGVKNTCHQGSPDGPVDVAEGKAKIVANSRNAKLKVSFFGPFYVGNYWVLDRADDYSWAIVGEPSGSYLWLLSRKPTLTAEEKKELMERISTLGYDLSLLRETRH